MQTPLNYTSNHSRWASLSKFMTIGAGGGGRREPRMHVMGERVPVTGTRGGARQVGEVVGPRHRGFKPTGISWPFASWVKYILF